MKSASVFGVIVILLIAIVLYFFGASFLGQGIFCGGAVDEDGTFCVAIAEKARDETFFYVDVTADGFIKDSREVAGCPGERVLNCGTFFLVSDRSYCLRVVRGDGEPLCKAAITLYWDLAKRPVLTLYSNREGKVVFGDSDVLGGVCGLTNVYFKAMATGYAPYFGKLTRGPVLLSEIVMEEDGYWRGRISDDSTGEGVEGASISLNTTIVPWMDVRKSVTAISDKSGNFVLRRISFDLEDFSLVASADGYNNCYPNRDEFAGIRLEPLKGESISGRIVNAVTNCPLDQQVVTVNGREILTGYGGEFSCIINQDVWDFVRVSAKGFKTEEYPLPGVVEFYAGMLEARLYPVIQESFGVEVVNAIGESIPGAFAKIRYWQNEPPFVNGFVFVGERPDTQMDFSLADVLSDNRITVVIAEEKGESRYVGGMEIETREGKMWQKEEFRLGQRESVDLPD